MNNNDIIPFLFYPPYMKYNVVFGEKSSSDTPSYYGHHKMGPDNKK